MLLALLFLIAASYGCEKHYVIDSPALLVTNMTGTTIQIKTKLCSEDSDDSQQAFSVPAGNTRSIPVFNPCIDALATNSAGEILGTQSRLRIPPNVKWSIY